MGCTSADVAHFLGVVRNDDTVSGSQSMVVRQYGFERASRLPHAAGVVAIEVCDKGHSCGVGWALGEHKVVFLSMRGGLARRLPSEAGVRVHGVRKLLSETGVLAWGRLSA